MNTDLIFPAQVLLGLLTWSLLARWFVAPRLVGLPREVALQPLLAVHTLRYIGLVFLAPAATGGSLAQTFAAPAGLGTAIAGVLALASIALLRARSRFAIPLVWIFTVEGIADFVNAFAQSAQRRRRVAARGGVLRPDRRRPGRARRARHDPRSPPPPPNRGVGSRARGRIHDLGIQNFFSFLVYGLFAWWYVWPWLRSVDRTTAFTALTFVHALRSIG